MFSIQRDIFNSCKLLVSHKGWKTFQVWLDSSDVVQINSSFCTHHFSESTTFYTHLVVGTLLYLLCCFYMIIFYIWNNLFGLRVLSCSGGYIYHSKSISFERVVGVVLWIKIDVNQGKNDFTRLWHKTKIIALTLVLSLFYNTYWSIICPISKKGVLNSSLFSWCPILLSYFCQLIWK